MEENVSKSFEQRSNQPSEQPTAQAGTGEVKRKGESLYFLTNSSINISILLGFLKENCLPIFPYRIHIFADKHNAMRCTGLHCIPPFGKCFHIYGGAKCVSLTGNVNNKG
jgi:hypothetical protein